MPPRLTESGFLQSANTDQRAISTMYDDNINVSHSILTRIGMIVLIQAHTGMIQSHTGMIKELCRSVHTPTSGKVPVSHYSAAEVLI